ncbi:hypothetical protein LCL97_15090 [Seohaeicola saemankumensis]|nr:hypothetical protein [Seohaeicola saemankumensis]MCA0872164.1 hypothetical protein [Seohaeicola saemankumensis]
MPGAGFEVVCCENRNFRGRRSCRLSASRDIAKAGQSERSATWPRITKAGVMIVSAAVAIIGFATETRHIPAQWARSKAIVPGFETIGYENARFSIKFCPSRKEAVTFS